MKTLFLILVLEIIYLHGNHNNIKVSLTSLVEDTVKKQKMDLNIT